jgi:hypothetical protein
MATDFLRKNVLYEAARAKREKAIDLYEGGDRVEKKAEYLIRHPFETDAQYGIRLKGAAYRNFASPIADIFASFVCNGKPQRELPESLQPILPDTDKMGTDADVFFGSIVRLAAAGGIIFVLVDNEGQQGRTIAEERQAGRRLVPYFVSINPDDVYDWHVDNRGLAWAVIHSREVAAAEPFSKPEILDVLTVWTRNAWRRYTCPVSSAVSGAGDTRQGGGPVYSLDGEGRHALGLVPLVPFIFEPVRESPMLGNSVIDDVLSLILRVYRRDSERDKMLFDCAVPLGIINGIDLERQKSFLRASSNILFSSEKDGISGKYLESSGSSFDALRAAIEEDIASIREIALRMVRPLSAVGESAESKEIDRQQLDTQLAVFARRCANAETQCWKVAAAWLGLNVSRDDIKTPYNENYSVKATEAEVKTAFLQLRKDGDISRETIWRRLGMTEEQIEEERALLESETRSGIGPGGAIGEGFRRALTGE